MKNPAYLLVLLSLTGCTAIKMLSSEEIKPINGCSGIVFESKMPLVELEIDKARCKFLFDTGAGISVLTDSTVIEGFQKKKFGYLGSSTAADGKKTKNRFLTAAVKSELFESENKSLAFINVPPKECVKLKRTFSGILGMDVFSDQKEIMQLDFTNNRLCTISNDQGKSILADNGYVLVKSECRKSTILLFISIDGKEFKFKLDTGYVGNITMPLSEETVFKNYMKTELEGSMHQTVSGMTNGEEIYYENIPVTFGKEQIATKLTVSNTIKSQNVGIEFIKGFDWIIDYSNNKVYIKRNKNKIESTSLRKIAYYSRAYPDHRLRIAVKEKSQTQYNLGDEIIAVNNQEVTPENICEMQDLLNKTADWTTLNIEIRPLGKK